MAAWKKRSAYCRAVLNYPTRIALDGSLTDEIVDDLARRDLAHHAQRKLAREKPAAAEPVEKPPAKEEPLPEPARVEGPKATCPPELTEGLSLDEQEDQIRFRLRVFRRYERTPQEALLDEAFAITGERLPRSTLAACRTEVWDFLGGADFGASRSG